MRILTTSCKNYKSFKRYNGFVQDLTPVTQVQQGLRVIIYVEIGAGLHLSVQNVPGYHFYGTQCSFGHSVLSYGALCVIS